MSAGPDTQFFSEEMSSGERFQKLVEEFSESGQSETFVRRALQQLESDYREMALLALSDWHQLGIVSTEMFQSVTSLQRPSWGSWNGMLTGLTKARRSALKNADDELRQKIESAEFLSSVLQQLELRIDSDVVNDLKPLADLTRAQLPKKTRLRLLLTMPISLRNRIAHDAPADVEWWNEAATAMKPLAEFHAHLSPITLLLADTTYYPEPWFVEDEEDGTLLVFNGLANDQSVIYVTPSGKPQYEPTMTHSTMLAFQRLLGKTGQQEDDFRSLLSKLAPEDIKGVMMGKYLVGRPVSQADFASLHVGRELNTGRKLAIKILRDDEGDDSRELFQQEARFVSRIDHPNVAYVYGHGEETWSAPRAFSLSDEDWFESFSRSSAVKCYIAMEWIDGKPLADYIDLPPAERPPLTTLVHWFQQTTDALAAVHSSGLIHCGIGPRNVMVGDDGEIKVIDFGDSRSQSKDDAVVTGGDDELEAPAYMSPEQLRAGEADSDVGPPTDIYSVCATFYDLIAGQRLYGHDQAAPETVAGHKLSGDLPDKPSDSASAVPWELDTILLGGLEPDVENRYRTMEALKLDIDRFLRDEPIEFRRPPLARRLRLGYRRHRLVSNLCVVFLVLAVIGTVSYVRDIQKALQAERDAHQRRIGAEIQLLRTGDPQAARIALQNLRKFADDGDDIRGLVDGQLREGDADDNEDVRLRMALLELVDDQHGAQEHTDPLLTSVQTASPAEVMLARQVLQPHVGEVAEPVWNVLLDDSEPPGERLRAASCLAAWAADDSRWEQVGGIVAERLIEENRLEIAEWIAAFRDVAPYLVPRLAELFQDPSLRQGERLIAATLLRSFAADDPETLADLVVAADREQFAELFPVVRRQKDEVVPLLQAVLEQTVSRDDLPLNDEWTSPPAETVETIEGSQGLIADRFAFAMSLQLSELESINAGLSVAGYRPLQVRARGELTAVLWTRDGARTVVETGLSKETLVQRVEELRFDDLFIIDACKRRTGTPARPEQPGTGRSARPKGELSTAAGFAPDAQGLAVDEYVAVFSEKRPGSRPTRLSVNDPEQDAATWVAEGFQPLTWQVADGADGDRVTSVWYRPSTLYPIWDVEAGAPNAIMGSKFETTGSPAHDLSVHPGDETTVANALWVLRRDVNGLTDIGPLDDDRFQRMSELAAAGWRMVAVSAGESSEGETIAATAWHQPLISDEVHAALGKKQAVAAVALLRLALSGGDPEKNAALAEPTWQLLKHSQEPGVRSALIHLFQPLGVPADALARRLADEPDVSIRRGLILALGEYSAQRISRNQHSAWTLAELLLTAWREDPDPGIHSAAEWTLRQWGASDETFERVGEEVAEAGLTAIGKLQQARQAEVSTSDRPDYAPRGWFVNPEGHTMVIVPRPVQFTMGADVTAPNWNTKSDLQHKRIIPRGFAIATTEVRLAQFLRFVKDADLMEFTRREGGNGKLEFGSSSGEGVRMEASVAGINVLAAAVYCNWLSQREGLPESEWCYHIVEKDGAPVSVEQNPDYLRRTGYRLPTEAEWEFACRAGATTTRFFGHSRELLDEYAWYGTKTRGVRRPVATLKPNDLGLFDMLGNAEELCELVSRSRSRSTIPDCFTGRPGPVDDGASYCARGSQYNYVGSKARDSYMRTVSADRRSNGQSFRVARTWQTRRDQLEGLTELMADSPRTGELYLERALAAGAVGEYGQAERDYLSYVQSAAEYTGGLWLTGRGEHVAAPHIAFDQLEEFTVEAVVRDWSQSVVYQGIPPANKDDAEQALFLNSDRVGWMSADGFSGSSIADAWVEGVNHIALVNDGAGLLTFVNGELVEKTAAGELVVDPDTPLLIGSGGGRAFGSGLIAGLRISSTARYSEMTESESTNADDPAPELDTLEADDATILFYDFTDISGRHIEDRSGNDRHGKLMDAWWLGPEERVEETD